MKYLVVENRQSVLLGPTFWKQRFIQSEFDELEVEFSVPPVEQGYIRVNDTYEILPVSDPVGPAVDPLYEEMVGPFYTYGTDNATATTGVQALSVERIRSNLKAVSATERYTRECAGTTVTIGGVVRALSTNRDARTQFESLLSNIGNDQVNWKFSTEFASINKSDVTSIVSAIQNHVQAQFDWEKGIHDSIDAASTVEQFKAIVIVTPRSVPAGPTE